MSEGAQSGSKPRDLALTKSTVRVALTKSTVRVALIVGGLFLAGIIIGRVTAPDGGSSDDGDATGEVDAAADEPDGATRGLPFPTGDVNRTNYWGFANLEPVVIDTFDRSDADSLGDAGTDQAWLPVAGNWGIRDNSAAQLPASGSGTNLALVENGAQGYGLTEVTMTTIEEGAGLIFRFSDPENYWSVTANPGVGTWSVTRVIDGESESVGEVPGPAMDGVTVSVIQNEASLRFLIDGEQYLAITDEALANQLSSGLIGAGSPSRDARWDRFMVMRFRETSPTETTVPEG